MLVADADDHLVGSGPVRQVDDEGGDPRPGRLPPDLGDDPLEAGGVAVEDDEVGPALADLVEALIRGGETLPDWQVAMTSLGVSEEAMAAIGLAPLATPDGQVVGLSTAELDDDSAEAPRDPETIP